MKQTNIPSKKFNFFIPANFEKSGENGVMKISGICSSKAEDSDGETLLPEGFNFQPLLESGYFNWNHQSNKSSSAIVGRPTQAKVVNSGRDFYVEGFLYKGLPEAKAIYNLAKTLQEEDPTRQLGFSIEGQATERDPINPKRIKKATITGVAITHCPKNPNTLLNIVKGNYDEQFVEESTKPEPSVDITRWQKLLDRRWEEACCDTEFVNYANEVTNSDGGSISVVDPSVRLPYELKETLLLNKGYIGKSMTTENTPMPESVEGKPKKQVEDDKVVSKSEIYHQIFSRYTEDIEKSNQIYNFIKQTSTQLYNMATITNDTLTKAFELLDSTIAKSKTEADSQDVHNGKKEVMSGTQTNEELEKAKKEKEALEKQEELEKSAKELFDMNKSRGEMIDTLVQKGFDFEPTKTTVEKLIAEYQANKEGGDIKLVAKDLSSDLAKSLANIELLIQSNNDNLAKSLGDTFSPKFTAIGQILKEQHISTSENKEVLNTLKKSFSELQERLEKIETEPQPKKTVTNFREKFEKSNTNSNLRTYALTNREDRQALSSVMFQEVVRLRDQGRNTTLLEKSIMDLEITKSMPSEILSTLKDMDIEVIN